MKMSKNNFLVLVPHRGNTQIDIFTFIVNKKHIGVRHKACSKNMVLGARRQEETRSGVLLSL